MAVKDYFKIGDEAPDFTLLDKDKNEISLSSFKGKWIILYFYPKDNTPGCTTEAIDFSLKLKEFEDLNAVIIGISPDSCEQHSKFAEKHSLTVKLLSDTENIVLETYAVWQEKKNFGKIYDGVVRTTFIINPEGNISYFWEAVKVKEHAKKVYEKLTELQKG